MLADHWVGVIVVGRLWIPGQTLHASVTETYETFLVVDGSGRDLHEPIYLVAGKPSDQSS